MKRLSIVFALLALSLSACLEASAPGGGRCNKGVCVKINAVEPIRFGEPVTVTITATSEKDISNLGVSLYLDGDVAVEEPQSVEMGVKDQAFWKGGASWGIDAKANSPLTFTRKVRFPPREGFFTLVASVSTPSGRATDSITIYVTRDGGKVYLSGTPIPTMTPGPLPTLAPWMRTPSPTPKQRPYP